MTESRDPKTCPSCGTVNPWLNEKCRGCGADISDVSALEPPPAELKTFDAEGPEREDSADIEKSPDEALIADNGVAQEDRPSRRPQRKKWNVLWIVIGILLYMAVVAVGEMVVIKWIVAPDPELKAAVEELNAQKDSNSMSEERRAEIKAMVFGNVKFVAATVLLLLISPVLIGCVVGFFSKGILEGAAAMGLAAVFALFQAGQPAIALIAGPVYAGLGVLGALGGRVIFRRIRGEN